MMSKQKILVLGAGFAGLHLVKKLSANDNFEITLIDKHNYHQFQPLLYQVATSGVEPSSISFPLRRILRKKSVRIRYCTVKEVNRQTKEVITSDGNYPYDKLIIAMGADTNYFGNKLLEDNCIPMKSLPEALFLRNTMLSNYEKAVVLTDPKEREAYMNLAVVGGGATGVELAGTLAEMKSSVFKKDYPELDFTKVKIRLIEAGPKLLPALSTSSSEKVLKYLKKLGVDVMLRTAVKSFDGNILDTGEEQIPIKCVIWAAGIKGNTVKGIDAEMIGRAGRIKTDQYNMV